MTAQPSFLQGARKVSSSEKISQPNFLQGARRVSTEPTTRQEIARGLGEGALRTMDLPALAMLPLEKALGKKSEGEINLPGREQELSRQHQILQKEAQGQKLSLGELQALADESEIAPYATRRTSRSILGELQQEIPKGGALQEGIARTVGAIPTLAAGPAAYGGALASEGMGLAAREAAKAGGMGETGQTIADVTGSFGRNIVGGAKKLAKQEVKMASGLTKAKVIEKKYPKLAQVTPEFQKAHIENLEKEAAKLARTSMVKHRPLIEKIESGHDFKSDFEKSFGQVKSLAEKHNIQIDTTPLMSFIDKSKQKFKGIPNPHTEAKKIIADANKFSHDPTDKLGKLKNDYENKVKSLNITDKNAGIKLDTLQRSYKNAERKIIANAKNPPMHVVDLLKTFRSNHQKVKHTYETAFVKGKQKEYVDYLMDQNREIAKSIKNTLPEDSQFVKLFEGSNKNFKDYMDALAVKNDLKYILGEKPTLHRLTEFADNAQKQKQLTLHMGKQGADEIIQISKDLRKATNAIKDIPVKEIKSFADVLPPGYFLADFIPVVGPAYKRFHGLKYGVKAARSVYGHYLLRPESRRAYSEALKAFADKNPRAFKTATKKIADTLEKSEEQ